MKKTLTILLFFSFTITVNAQYESIFGEEKTVWTMTDGSFLGITFDSCLIQGDTIINDHIYKKGRWLINDFVFEYEPDFYLREDTITGKAWVKIEDEEQLFMDLSLSVGDSFNIVGGNWIAGEGNYIIDSIYYLEGRKYIRIDYPLFWIENEKMTFIEGIGSNVGYMAFRDNLHPFLLCTKKEDSVVYKTQNISYNDVCGIPTASTFLEDDAVLFKVFPNPATNYFDVALNRELVSTREKTRLTVFNIMGSILHSKQLSTTDFPINISTVFWNRGLYYIQLQSDRFNYISPIIVH